METEEVAARLRPLCINIHLRVYCLRYAYRSRILCDMASEERATTNVRLRPCAADRLRAVANDEGRTMSKVVELALDAYTQVGPGASLAPQGQGEIDSCSTTPTPQRIPRRRNS